MMSDVLSHDEAPTMTTDTSQAKTLPHPDDLDAEALETDHIVTYLSEMHDRIDELERANRARCEEIDRLQERTDSLQTRVDQLESDKAEREQVLGDD